MVAHACILFQIELLKAFLLYDTGKLCSKFSEDWSMNNVTILSTDAGWMDRWTFTWFYVLSNATHCIGQTIICIWFAVNLIPQWRWQRTMAMSMCSSSKDVNGILVRVSATCIDLNIYNTSVTAHTHIIQFTCSTNNSNNSKSQKLNITVHCTNFGLINFVLQTIVPSESWLDWVPQREPVWKYII